MKNRRKGLIAGTALLLATFCGAGGGMLTMEGAEFDGNPTEPRPLPKLPNATTVLAEKGRAVYLRAQCVGCHAAEWAERLRTMIVMPGGMSGMGMAVGEAGRKWPTW